MSVKDSSPGLRFINETANDAGQRNTMCASTRRIVRSQAMIAVRRKQRLDAEVYMHLRWTAPKLAAESGSGSESEGEGGGLEESKNRRSVCKYAFVEEVGPAVTKVCDRREKAKRGKAGPDLRFGAHSKKARSKDKRLQLEPSLPQESAASMPHIIERLGGGRRNPFESYPVPFNDEVNELMDHYTVVIPYLMYGTRVKSPMQKLLYHLSFDNLAALCAIMTLASRHIDSLQGIRESSRSLRHMTAALRAVNDMLGKGPSACNDATIFAVTLLATVERRLGNALTSKKHWLGLRKLLGQRGGLQAISSNRQLKAMIIWNDLVFAKDQHAAEPQSCEWPSLIDNDLGEGEPGTRRDELFEFLDQLEDTWREISDREQTCRTLSRIWKQRRKVFSQGSVMYGTLLGEPEVRGHQRSLTALACQHACLIYLGVTFLEYADQLHMEELFLSAMEALTHEELCKGLSPEHLLARLLMGLISEDAAIAGERAAKVISLMLGLKRLDSDMTGRVRERLWRCVSLTCPAADEK